MAFAAYLLENAMLVLALGRVFAHLWGFWMNRPAPPWGTGSLSKKKQKKKKKRKMPGGRWNGHAWNCLNHY